MIMKLVIFGSIGITACVAAITGTAGRQGGAQKLSFSSLRASPLSAPKMTRVHNPSLGVLFTLLSTLHTCTSQSQCSNPNVGPICGDTSSCPYTSGASPSFRPHACATARMPVSENALETYKRPPRNACRCCCETRDARVQLL